MKSKKLKQTRNRNMSKPNTIKIDEVEYVRKDQVQEQAFDTDGKPYVIIRSADSGVHAGYLLRKNGNEVELVNARRIWSWEGAATLSQIATDGVKSGKIPCAVNLTVLGVCEIIKATEKARRSIEGVPVWEE